MKNILFAVLAVSVAFSACKKKEDPAPAKSKTQLLCAHYWKLTALTVNPPIDFNGTQISDLYAQYEECSKDDILKFNEDKTYVYDEGPTKCDPSDPQTQPGTWLFNSTETIITVDGDNQNILTLNETEFKVSFQESLDGVTYTFTGTYSKN